MGILDVRRYPRRVTVPLEADTAADVERLAATVDGRTVAAVCRAAIARGLPSVRDGVRKERARRPSRDGRHQADT